MAESVSSPAHRECRGSSIPPTWILLPALGALIISVSCRVGAGDCLMRTLPADGNWTTFYCTEEFDDGNKRTFYVTIKAGEKTLVDGRDCQWTELIYRGDKEKKKGSVFKFLIAVDQLGPDGDPLKS